MDGFTQALIAQNPCEEIQDELHLFGQFVGEWGFEWHWNNQQGYGRWIFSYILGGKGIQDVFIWPVNKESGEKTPSRGEYGTTIRIYNKAENYWNISYIDSGAAICGIAKAKGNDIIIDISPSEQWSFLEITSTTFHWQNKQTNDGGKTWQLKGELFATREN